MHAALAAHVDALPDDVSVRLAQARSRALDALAAGGAAEVPQRAGGASRWAPSFALAATLLLAFGVWDRAAVSPLAALPPLPTLEDPQEARAAQDIELLDELEFVAWMELQAAEDAPQGEDAGLLPGAAADLVPGTHDDGVRHAG